MDYTIRITDNVVRNILIIYCGGTIGMKKNSNGAYEPQPNQFIQKIRSYPELHDKSYPVDNKQQFVIHVNGVTIHYTIREYDPLLDSSNMSVSDWVRIAKDIEMYYDKYDAFIVLHGTDTLAYTASALSFMLEGLKKTVIITGAQISIFERRSDAKDNFLSSIIFAGCYDIGEVCVCFAHKLIRGNRTVKCSSNKLRAFDSPNYHYLGKDALKFEVYSDYILKTRPGGNFKIFTNMNSNITIITFHPTITSKTIECLLGDPIDGAVLQSYGIGNIATNRKDIMGVFKKAAERGVLIVNVTQCNHGTVDCTYETGRALAEVGVVPGIDMSLQAAYTKLSYILGQTQLSLKEKKMMMMTNIRGEMTVCTNDVLFKENVPTNSPFTC